MILSSPHTDDHDKKQTLNACIRPKAAHVSGGGLAKSFLRRMSETLFCNYFPARLHHHTPVAVGERHRSTHINERRVSGEKDGQNQNHLR